jgi:ABC-type cobalamin/Fe3+-siderophores transport system ATPase subunit
MERSLAFKGSQWRKWDLHLHTPISYTWDGANDEDAFKEVIRRINESDVALFAITDYWTFEGFEKLMAVNAKLSASERLRKTVLPGIELRFDILTDEANPADKTRVNFQVIFNNDDGNGVHRVDQFYKQLRLSSTAKVISRNSFIEVAKDYSDDVLQKLVGKKRSDCKDEDFVIAGYKSCYISYDCLAGIFTTRELRENAFLLVPWDKYGGISKIDPLLRDDTKKKLTKLANALESAKEETIGLFLLKEELLASKPWAESWRQFIDKQAKPCVCGSDAKRIESIGVFPNDRCCWIKADTTFEGLRQIIHEPSERVWIGSEDPSAFEHAAVGSITVTPTNETFFLNKVGSIYLSEGLNCVIGPRGAGKSSLLDVIAFTLGDEAVLRRDRNNYVGFFFKNNDSGILSAVVKKSSTGKAKQLSPATAKGAGFILDYYHQKRIGYLADPNNVSELSRFLFDKIFKDGRGMESLLGELDDKKDDFVSRLAINREQIVACTKEISKEPEIQAKIADGNNRVAFLSQDEIKHLLEERRKIMTLKDRVAKIVDRIDNLEEEPLISEDDIVDVTFFSELSLTPIDPEGTVVPPEWKVLEAAAGTFVQGRTEDRTKVETEVQQLTTKIAGLEPLFAFDTRLAAIWEQIQAESKKKGVAITMGDLEKLDSLQKDISSCQKQLKSVAEKKKAKATLLADRKKLLKKYADELASVKESLESSFNDLLKKDGAVMKETIQLRVEINLSLESHLQTIEEEARHDPEEGTMRFPNKKSLLEMLNSFGAEKMIRDLHNSYFADWNATGFGSGGLDYFLKMQNREEVAMRLEELLPSLTAHLFWRPDVSRDFKPLKECSIGERGTALLSVILISGRDPLIIDQPEDDLDHFYLYKTLTPIIKDVKKRRQLIFATHDANIVINGDAELVVIATTDDGKLGKVAATSLENLQNREWIMKVLEGGRDAFEKREQKYSIKK